MRIATLALATLIALATFAPAQDEAAINAQSAQLEAQLKKTLETSPNGARALLGLVDHYYQHGRVFGLVRNARKFAAAQPGNPRHKEVMIKLVDGLVITSRHRELTAAARQFLDKYGDSPEAAHVQRQLADTLAVQGKKADAAQVYGELFARLGREAVADGLRAVELYQGIENKEAFQARAQLAIKLLEVLPPDVRAAEAGWIGFQSARRYSDWATSNTIGEKLIVSGAPLDTARRFQLHREMGDNQSALGQHSNAIASYRKALGVRDDALVRQRIVNALLTGGAKPAQIEPELREFLNKFPTHEARWDIAAALAESYASDKQLDRALATTEKVLAGNSEARDLRRRFLGWLGAEPPAAQLQRVESALNKAIAANPRDAWKLRWTLAFDVYRDRMKNIARAKAVARQLLFEAPGNDASLKSALAWLFESAASDAEFTAEVNRAAAATRQFYHLNQYRGILGAWAHDKRGDKDWRQRAQIATQKYQAVRDSEFARRWTEGERDRHQGREHRQWLLGQQLSGEQRALVLRRQADSLGIYGNDTQKPESIPLYEQHHSLAADKWGAASAWVGAAGSYGTPQQFNTALAAMLQHPPVNNSQLWRGLIHSAVRAKDPAAAKRILAWIQAAQKVHGPEPNYADDIGDRLLELGLENEAVAYWKAHAIAGSNHLASAACANRLLARIGLEATDQRVAMLQPFATAESDFHGKYAASIAEEHFRAGKLDAFERVLTAVRQRQNSRTLRGWGLDEHPPQGWLERSAAKEEMSIDDKARVYRAVRDLENGRASSNAELMLLQIGRSDALSPTAQLLRIARATRISDTSVYTWDRLWPHGQSLQARNQNVQAAVLLTGMLENITAVDEGRREKARSLIRKAYAGMGALGFDIDEDSPIAPLLHIGLHLRLGDDDLAAETYAQNRELFDQHRSALPSAIIAFAAGTHIDEGGEAGHERAEDILRSWLIAHGEDPKIAPENKAEIGVLLAQNYQRAGRYEVARAEFTSVVNRFPKTEAAVEAKFGIGETYMEQKIFDQAEEVFGVLADTRVPSIVLRADFLRGVLAGRRGDREAAREIFRDVLGRMPDVDLADRTLYELAEVYGLEQRFLEQLDLLRTVGRLGRESKRWHVPGRALSVVVQDTDLGISRGHSKIPVVVRTDPGGDEEFAFLESGGAGRGLFMAEVPTVLGGAKPGDQLLQVTGSDLITVDYPDEFKSEFRFDLLANNQIRLGADARFAMASARILPEDEEDITAELRAEMEERELDRRKSATRPAAQVKPGNPIYFRVEDPDRNLGDALDGLPVTLVSSSGDRVAVTLAETAPHSGIFEGHAASGELPAGALASDSSIGESPLKAIDNDPLTAWVSEPDGAAPKWLLVDMKKLADVDKVIVRTPNAEQGAPVRLRLVGSHDGRYFYPLAEFPARDPDKLPTGEFNAMTTRVWKVDNPAFTRWDQVVELSGKDAAANEKVQSLDWHYQDKNEEEDQEAKRKRLEQTHHAVLWQGKLVQPKDGAMRIVVDGIAAAAMVDGRVVVHFGQEEASADLFLERGLHDIAIFATTTGAQPVSATRARENPNSPSVAILPFGPGDLDLESPLAKGLADVPLTRELATATAAEGAWEFALPASKLRHLRVVIDEFLGQSVAINQVEITGGGEQHIPTEADILALARNEVLEIAPGDQIVGSYIDEFTSGGVGRNRVLDATLTATYYNGSIIPISYDFERSPNGSVSQIRKELLRIDPGERITIEVADFDLDSTGGEDQVAVTVSRGSGEAIELLATETGPNTGIFRTQVDTAATAEPGKLLVAAGDTVYLRFRDAQNTFPGHAVEREAVVYVRVPTEGRLRIVETRVEPTPMGSGITAAALFLPTSQSAPDAMRGIAYTVPLTVEVIDPDAARDSRSTVVVTLATENGEPVRVACEISATHAEIDPTLAEVSNPALHQGRFLGQVSMRLGGPNSPSLVPLDAEVPSGLAGRVLPPEEPKSEEEGADALEIESVEAAATATTALVTVFNITGSDVLGARYTDDDRPDGAAQELTERGRIISDGRIAITDKEYEEPAEILFLGERLYLRVEDADRDLSDARDKVAVTVTTTGGERETVELEETLSHSGLFTGSFGLGATATPTPQNISPGDGARIEGFFAETLKASYRDETPAQSVEPIELSGEVPIARGTDGLLASFSKVFSDEELAIQTQFHIAEAYFELFKSHLDIGRKKEAAADLKAGRKVLAELAEDYPNPRYKPRVAYLLGNFSQEMKQWDEAIVSYSTIVRDFPEHALAADAQYKLGQCYEQAGQFDDALEAYVTLAATYPKSPLIASVMMRINEHFYRDENYLIAAQVAEKFLERFEAHEHAPRMAFRAGQCYYKADDFPNAGETFDHFSKKFPDDDLAAQALFWGGESYRMANKIPEAFWRYNRCRTDFPESEAAKYARGRLALPELLAQFEREAAAIEAEQ